MSTNAVQSTAYNYAYETNGAKEKETKNTSGTDDSVFLGCAENDTKKVDNTNASDFEYACTDGNNDGKLGAGEFCKSAFRGIAKLVLSPVTEAMKGNFGPAIGAAVGAVAIGLLGAPAVVAAGAIGAVTGGAMLIDGGIKYFSADNDADAKKAAEQIGGGGFTAISSLLAFRGGMKSLKKSNTSNLGKYYDDKGKVLRDPSTGKKMKPSFGDKVKAYGQDLGESFGNAGRKVTGVFHKNSDAPETTPVSDDSVPLTDDDGLSISGADDGTSATGGGAADDGLTTGGAADVPDGRTPLTGDGAPDGGTPLTGDGAPDGGTPLTGDGAQSQPEVKPFDFRRMTAEEAAASNRAAQGQPSVGDNPDLLESLLDAARQQQAQGGATGGAPLTGETPSPMLNPSDLNAGGTAAPASSTGTNGTFGTNTTKLSTLDANKASLNRLKSMNISKSDSGYYEWLNDIQTAQDYVDASINHDMMNYIRSL